MTCDFEQPQTDQAPSPLHVDSARADRIVQQLTGWSRAAVRGLFDHGCVRINDSIASAPQQTVRRGDRVEVSYDPRRRYKPKPAAKPNPAFDLLYEDDHVLVVNKSPHVFTVPTPTDKGKTLIAALEDHMNFKQPAKSRRKLHVVQRLDRGVSGVLAVAKTTQAAADLRRQFESHKPQRHYIAIVGGAIDQPRGTFRSHMATGRTLNRYSTTRPGQGELAITHYEVLSRAREATVVRVQLETGRRNQIRVHFAEAGHPVLGDRRYGSAASAHPRWKAKRIALHAASLEFMHPATGKMMRFEAELPREFEPFTRGLAGNLSSLPRRGGCRERRKKVSS
jgi:23S rRNA pseudouridine1911/1915/1917 synthase